MVIAVGFGVTSAWQNSYLGLLPADKELFSFWHLLLLASFVLALICSCLLVLLDATGYQSNSIWFNKRIRSTDSVDFGLPWSYNFICRRWFLTQTDNEWNSSSLNNGQEVKPQLGLEDIIFL